MVVDTPLTEPDSAGWSRRYDHDLDLIAVVEDIDPDRELDRDRLLLSSRLRYSNSVWNVAPNDEETSGSGRLELGVRVAQHGVVTKDPLIHATRGVEASSSQ